jgi:hypothetical protein
VARHVWFDALAPQLETEYFPLEHCTHAPASVCFSRGLDVPAGHSVHDTWPSLLLYLPLLQAKQARSEFCPFKALLVPAGQGKHAVLPAWSL